MNKSLAAHYYKLSADQGNARAQFNYGFMLLHGDGISMNKSLAAHYFKLSADQGIAEAQCNYGFMLSHREGISMNKSLAAHYYKLSADQGNARAQYHYGFMLLHGDGISMNKSLAAHYLKLSADQGIAAAQYNYGFMLLHGEDISMNKSLAAHYLKLSADQGIAEAQSDYGIMLLHGEVISLNKSLAAHYFKLSADQGDARAQFFSGVMLDKGEGISMNKSLAVHYFKLSADQGLSLSQLELANLLLRGDHGPINSAESENYLRLAVGQGSSVGQLRLGLCLFYGSFGHFDLAEARDLFDISSKSDPFAVVLRNAISLPNCELLGPSDFFRDGNLFSVLRFSFNASDLSLIRVLNGPMCDFSFEDDLRFAAWHQTAGYSLPYLVDASRIKSYALTSLPSDVLSCTSISEMTRLIFRMYTIESPLYKHVNSFLRSFPVSKISKFKTELRGILSYISLLQSSIEYLWHTEPFEENAVVYRGITGSRDFGSLYFSMIGDVVVWPGFTSTSRDRDYVLKTFITNEDCVLFEIEVHPGDIAVNIQGQSRYQHEDEILIPASTAFKVISADDVDVLIPARGRNPPSVLRISVVKLSYFLPWCDFDLDNCPAKSKL
jgi:TPR repeat protein